jgi:hypothetical protein
MVARDIFNNPSDFLGELPKQIWEAGNNGGCQNTACTITATRAARCRCARHRSTGAQQQWNHQSCDSCSEPRQACRRPGREEKSNQRHCLTFRQLSFTPLAPEASLRFLRSHFRHLGTTHRTPSASTRYPLARNGLGLGCRVRIRLHSKTARSFHEREASTCSC